MDMIIIIFLSAFIVAYPLIKIDKVLMKYKWDFSNIKVLRFIQQSVVFLLAFGWLYIGVNLAVSIYKIFEAAISSI